MLKMILQQATVKVQFYILPLQFIYIIIYCILYIYYYYYNYNYYYYLMASIKLTRNEVLGLLFADPDSEGEYLPSEGDGDSESESKALHQAQMVNPLPNVSGGNNVSRGRSVHREVSRRVSVVGNEAGDFYRASVALSSDRVPHRNRGDSIVVETNATGYVRRGRSIHRTVRGQRGGRVGSRNDNDSSPSCAHSARAVCLSSCLVISRMICALRWRVSF